MKRINLLLLAAFSMAIFACSPDNSEGNGGSDYGEIVGTWYIGMNPVWPEILDSMYIDQPGTITFTSDGKFAQNSAWDKADGSYSYSKGVFSATVEHSWWYDSWEKERVAVPIQSFPSFRRCFHPSSSMRGTL